VVIVDQVFKGTVANMRQRLMRDNVAQIAVLEVVPGTNYESCTLTRRYGASSPLSNLCDQLTGSVRKLQSGPLICITNVHIFSNPKFPDVKLWQSNMVVKQVRISHMSITRCWWWRY
jgi:CCR4-NOT transcription complex subunit 6